MVCARIFYTTFIDEKKDIVNVGGIQNYIVSLDKIFKNNNIDTAVYMPSENDFDRIVDGIRVIGIKTDAHKSVKAKMKNVLSKVVHTFGKEDILIWGSETIAIKSEFKNTLAIQHGIGFDLIQYNAIRKIWSNPLMSRIYKYMQCYKAVKNFLISEKTVCVDYNYLNWIRTQLPRTFLQKIEVIPNYATPSEKRNIIHFDTENIKILFARRFSFERGSEIMLEIIPYFTNKYKNVSFTLCGEGPYGKTFQEKFGNNSQVTITKFKVGESEEFNLNHHISLVPTYGSEGTSFSLLEAMACGSIPVASNVGGMTNVIIDAYNGYLVNPTTQDFINQIEEIIKNIDAHKVMSQKAYETIEMGVSSKIWEEKWINTMRKFDLIKG